MKPIDQTIFGFEKGNCFQACIASILEKPINSIPNFSDGDFRDNIIKWMKDSNNRLMEIECNDFISDVDLFNMIFKDIYIIATGTSPRSPRNENKLHAVIYHNGELVHDPHPDRKGIIGSPKCITFFIDKNPESKHFFIDK